MQVHELDTKRLLRNFNFSHFSFEGPADVAIHVRSGGRVYDYRLSIGVFSLAPYLQQTFEDVKEVTLENLIAILKPTDRAYLLKTLHPDKLSEPFIICALSKWASRGIIKYKKRAAIISKCSAYDSTYVGDVIHIPSVTPRYDSNNGY